MKRFIARARQSSFLRYNTLFFAGSVAVGVLNYLYYPILGRMLPASEFGEVQVLVSLFLQATTFLTVFGMITVNILATYQDRAKAQRAIFELEKLALWFSFGLLIIVFFSQDVLKTAFKFDTGWPFTMLALTLVVSVSLTFRSAYLRGVKRFGQSSATYVVGATGKLLLSALFVWLGFSTLGAIGGIVAAQIIAFFYAARLAGRAGFAPQGKITTIPHVPSVLPELRYAGLVCLSSLIVTLLFSVDVIIIKYLFDPQTAGLYAGIATVARIIFFLTLSISQVLLPLVSLQHSARANRGVLFKSLALTFAVSLPVLLICWIFPEMTVSILMGAEYAAFSSLLPLLALAIFVLSIGNLFVLYHMALRRWGLAIVVGLCAIIALVLMGTRHSDPQAIVENLLYSSLSLLILLGLWILQRRVSRKQSDRQIQN